MEKQNTEARDQKSEHTPGPWKVEQPIPHGGCDIYGQSKNNGREYICTTSGRAKANAQLIAAAPDLLEALEAANLALNECVKYLLGSGAIPEPEAMALTTTQIEEAIAKAKGR